MCTEGQYKSGDGSGLCDLCEQNSYLPIVSDNITDCICNAGYSVTPGGDTCKACETGKYVPPGGNGCLVFSAYYSAFEITTAFNTGGRSFKCLGFVM